MFSFDIVVFILKYSSFSCTIQLRKMVKSYGLISDKARVSTREKL